MQIKSQAMAICLDREVRNLQRQLVEQQNSSPDPRQHRAAIVGAVTAALIALSMIWLSRNTGRASLGWIAGLAAPMIIVSMFRYTTQRRVFRTVHAIWQREHRRLDEELTENWQLLDALEKNNPQSNASSEWPR
jgi:hypothetical protein